MPARVLALAASPRPGSNSEALLEEALRAVRDQGATVEKIKVAGLRVGGCKACDYCLKGTCVQKDDMQELYPRLAAADALIVAAPIYFYSLPAQVKAVIDRCQLFWNRRRGTGAPVRPDGRRGRGSLIAVGATRGAKLFLGPTLVARYFFEALEADYFSDLLVRGVDAAGAIGERPAELERAYQLGRELVQGL